MNHESQPTSPTTNRRDFFSAGARCLAIGGIASFALLQELKRRRLCGDPNCIRLNTCSDCIEFTAGCSKDKAQNFRAQQQG